MNPQLLLELGRFRDRVIEEAIGFTQDDWDRVLINAYKLTAEVKVERANKPLGPWMMSS